MKENPLFSLLIANYNNGQYLQECLESIYSQTYTRWEIIIVDDFSTDTSREIYKTFDKDNRIKVYYNKINYGCGYTKRQCVKKASGELCAFLDPDDTIERTALERLVKEHVRLPSYSIIYTSHYICDVNLNIIRKGATAGAIPKGFSQINWDEGKITAFASFKRKLYNKTEGINKTFMRAVDQDLYYKLEETGPTYYLNEFLYYYRIHEGGISTTNNSTKAYYAHLIVKLDTYLRRKKKKIKKNYPYNIRYKSLMRSFGNYHLDQSHQHNTSNNKAKAIKHLLISLRFIPYNRQLLYRIKLLIDICKKR